MLNEKLMTWARYYTGLVETPGAASNPILLDMARILKMDHFIDDTKQNWCGLFVSFIAFVCGCALPGNPTIAKNWATHGAPVMKGQELPGDIVVLASEDPASPDGHIGFFESHSEDGAWISLFGGNQVDAVRSQRYARSRVIAIRRLYAA